MCDYSLHLVTSRPAKVGDKLVSTNFSNSLTRGFAAVGGRFERDVFEYRHFPLPNRKLGEKVARFRQFDMDNPNTHHGALEFPNGQIVLLNRLCEG
jgi:hypothetical protein